MNIPFLPKIFPLSARNQQADYEQQLIRAEAEIGGKLFGSVPEGHRRQFFCLDEYTWVWHEEWIQDGKQQFISTRYHVTPTGIIKSQDGRPQQRLTRKEARNLYRASDLYYRRINAYYQQLLAA